MAKEKDRMTVECDFIYLNDSKPTDWAQTFEWKPSVSFYYFEMDDNFKRVGELQKTWIKNDLWLFQAMGGKNGKGHFFDIMITRGEYKGKPTASVMPVAEMFPDGSARMIKPPKDGKVSVPASTKPPVVPSTQKTTPPPPKAPAASKPPVEPRPGVPLNNKPKPKPGEKFIERCFTPSTNEFFRMQDGFAQDGYIATQSGYLAMEATRNFIGWRNQRDSENCERAGTEFTPAGDAEFKIEFERWVEYFDCQISHRQWSKNRDRMYSILLNCTTVEQITSCVEMAWAKLPKSYYDMVRTKARERLAEIDLAQKSEQPLALSSSTATPEVCQITEEPEPEIEEQIAEPIVEPVPPPPPPPPVIEPQIIRFAYDAIINAKNLKIVVDVWNTTRPELQALEEIKKAMWLWIDARFTEAQYQTDVDEIGKQFPMDILSEEQRTKLDARYAKLITF